MAITKFLSANKVLDLSTCFLYFWLLLTQIGYFFLDLFKGKKITVDIKGLIIVTKEEYIFIFLLYILLNTIHNSIN